MLPVVITGALLLIASDGIASSDYQYELTVHGQHSEEAVSAYLRQDAVSRAVRDFLGPPDFGDEHLRRRMQILAAEFAERLASVDYRDGPSKHRVQLWWARGRVTVSRQRLLELRDEIRAQLERPQPRVMVLVRETVEYTNWPWGPRPARDPEEGSKVSRRVEEQLLAAGFEVVAREQTEILRQKSIDFARLDGEELKTILSIAHDQGAELLILGHAAVTGPRRIDGGGGRPLYLWHTMPELSVVDASTARKVSVPVPERAFERGGNEFEGPAAARQALDNVGRRVGELVIIALLRRGIGDGPREIKVTIRNADHVAGRAIEGRLRQLDGVGNVVRRSARGFVEFRIMTELSATELADLLSELRFGAFHLRIDEVGAGKISARYEVPD